MTRPMSFHAVPMIAAYAAVVAGRVQGLRGIPHASPRRTTFAVCIPGRALRLLLLLAPPRIAA